jgi:hypothetical protein
MEAAWDPSWKISRAVLRCRSGRRVRGPHVDAQDVCHRSVPLLQLGRIVAALASQRAGRSDTLGTPFLDAQAARIESAQRRLRYLPCRLAWEVTTGDRKKLPTPVQGPRTTGGP